jgi:hypothetical protein
MRTLRFALLAGALALSSSVALAVPPARIALVYELVREGTPIAEVTEVLEHGAGRYSIASEAKGKGLLATLPLGTFRRDSSGDVTPEGLRPVAFRDQRGGRIAVATFDWPARTMTTEFRGQTESHPLDGTVHDRLTQLYTFAFAGLPRGEIAMRVTDGRGLSEQRFAVTGRERVTLRAGTFDTVRIERVREQPDDRREAVVWLAADRDYLPVRVLIVERDGARFDQTLERIGE